MNRRYDLLPAAFAFSQFPLYHSALRIAAEDGVEYEGVEEVQGDYDAPNEGNPLDPRIRRGQ